MEDVTPITGSREDGMTFKKFGAPIIGGGMLILMGVILACLLYIMASPRTVPVRVRPLPKPEPTMTLRFRAADAQQIRVFNKNLTYLKPSLEASKQPLSRPAPHPALAHWEVSSGVAPQRQVYSDGAPAKEIVVIPQPSCSHVWESRRVDCHPDHVPSYQSCVKRGCCFDPVNSTEETPEPGFILPPACFYPDNYLGYKVERIEKSPSRTVVVAQRVTPSGIPWDVNYLQIQVINYSGNTVRVRIVDSRFKRYEVQFPKVPELETTHPGLYDSTVTLSGEIQITRPSSRKFVFHSNISTLLYADQLLQLCSHLPSRYVYGIGDVKSPLLRSTEWHKITLFNAGRSPTEGKNLYGSHPFMMVLEESGEASGIFLLNSNAMDIILQPSPAVTFRTIGGILDFFVFLGPTPESVVQQYTAVVGRPFMPPYWSLGFHLSRWGYDTIEQVRHVWKRNIRTGIAVESVWLDADYMEQLKPFTFDRTRFTGMPEFVLELHKRDMKFVLTVHPGIDSKNEREPYAPFDEGQRRDIFIRADTGAYEFGRVGNRSRLVFPDFTHPQAGEYWAHVLSSFHHAVPFDGLWLDLNEPSSVNNGSEVGCPASRLEDPPYLPGDGQEPLLSMTLCMSAKLHASRHYDVHNLYSYAQAYRTYDALSQIMLRRPFIISRATFAGQGRYTGHWSGDIVSDWDSLRYSVSSMLTFNILGMPMTGSDICGFWDNATAELCHRWHALGAFYPFARNHNARGSVDQDPAAWGPRMSSSTRKILRVRYNFLPYLYTLFYRSHVFGDTVARPLSFEFPKDVNTYSIDTQFLWGSSLLILPIVDPNTTEVRPYLPRGVWYDTLLGTPYHSAGEDFAITPQVDMVCLLIRGGSVIPTQETAQTTAASRLKPFSLLVAKSHEGIATGELYWDDGEYMGSYDRGDYNLLSFTVVKNALTSHCVHCSYDTIMLLNAVVVYGVTEKPTDVRFNDHPANFTYNPSGQFMKVAGLHFQLTKAFLMMWSR